MAASPTDMLGVVSKLTSQSPSSSVRLVGSGLVLREWSEADLSAMVTLFDEPSIDVWTPLESPFDADAASRYLARARELRASGRGIQLAVTTDGLHALGEVLLFERGVGEASLAYAIGVEHRGKRLASRALRLLIEHATADRELTTLLLRIAPENVASQCVADACGFELTDEPIIVRERKGCSVRLATWRRTA